MDDHECTPQQARQEEGLARREAVGQDWQQQVENKDRADEPEGLQGEVEVSQLSDLIANRNSSRVASLLLPKPKVASVLLALYYGHT